MGTAGRAPRTRRSEPGTHRGAGVREETGWKVTAGPLLDTWLCTPIPGRRVLIITFACTVLTPDQPPVLSHEHKKIGLFPVDQVPGLTMPDGYKQSITTGWTRHVPPSNIVSR